MIEKINDISEFNDWKIRDIYSVRILSLLKSYGCKYQFAVFYKQVIDGKITAVLSKLDGDFTLSVDDGFDNDELLRFFCVTGYNTILCSNAFQLGASYEEGAVMCCSSKPAFTLSHCEIDEYPKLMDLFNFVDYEMQDFKAWYVDISHRVRHKTAKAYTLNVGGSIITSGILSSVIDGYSVLTAVRTADDFMNMGYGSTLVKYILNDVKGTVYIMRDMDRNEHFYQQIGFKNIGNWRIYR